MWLRQLVVSQRNRCPRCVSFSASGYLIGTLCCSQQHISILLTTPPHAGPHSSKLQRFSPRSRTSTLAGCSTRQRRPQQQANSSSLHNNSSSSTGTSLLQPASMPQAPRVPLSPLPLPHSVVVTSCQQPHSNQAARAVVCWQMLCPAALQPPLAAAAACSAVCPPAAMQQASVPLPHS